MCEVAVDSAAAAVNTVCDRISDESVGKVRVDGERLISWLIKCDLWIAEKSIERPRVKHCDDRIWRRVVTDGRVATACPTVSRQPSYRGQGLLAAPTRVPRTRSTVKYAPNNAIHSTGLQRPRLIATLYTVHCDNCFIYGNQSRRSTY